MIKLTIHPTTDPRILCFSQTSLVIGSNNNSGADLELPGEILKDVHIKIYEESGQFFALNVANDPFTSLRGKPFGKRKILNGDILKIGKTEIQFEGTSTISSLLSTPFQDRFTAPNTDIKADFDKIYLDAAEDTPSSDLEDLNPDNYRNSDEELDIDTTHPLEASKGEIFTGFRKSLLILISCLILLGLIGTGMAYRIFIDQSNRERLIAAEGIADVAMALAYAQVNHIKPQKQNWIDPEFLKNNLASILSSEYPSLSYIDNQGQFCNCPYLLRIYTNNDLSQFLIMAQPNPSLFQWLISTATIVVDSQHMELRSLYDLKTLNRLLVNANTIDRANADEIFLTVEQGELIPLASLGTSQGFSSPKALPLIRPGAENRIYNAPRYYHFGESLLTKAVELFKMMNSNQHELGRLQQQTSELSRFTNLVLYSSQGIHKAIHAQKALNALAPKHTFLLAYLNFKPNGTIADSHLLFDFDHLHLVDSTAINVKHEQEQVTVLDETAPAHSHHHAEHNAYQALALQANQLAQERKTELQAISTQIIAIFHDHEDGKLNNFNYQLQILLKQYEQVDTRSSQRIIESLKELYEEHSEIPLEELTHHLKNGRLEHIAQESLREIADASLEASQVDAVDITDHLKKIPASKSFIQLENAVSQVAALLTLSHLPSSDMIIHYQNEMRIESLKQLRMLLLSSNSPIKAIDLTEEQRIALANILKLIWVNDPDEYHYYLNEYDLLKETL